MGDSKRLDRKGEKMTIEEIRKGVPEGATHYIDHSGVKYYKLDEYGIVYIYHPKGFGGYQCLHLHISETVIKPL